MKVLKHIGVGFLVSFVGSLPLGYLNVAGLKVYASGFDRLMWYLLGVISIEVIIIYATLFFAEKLVKRKKLLRVIEAFSVLFMFALAAVFFVQAVGTEPATISDSNGRAFSPFILGVVLSSFNFLQLPFWVGWNLYLLNKKHIEPGRINETAYILGTAAGTFGGMLAFILVLAKLDSVLFSGYLMHIISLAFAVIGVVQAWKFYRKHLRKARSSKI